MAFGHFLLGSHNVMVTALGLACEVALNSPAGPKSGCWHCCRRRLAVGCTGSSSQQLREEPQLIAYAAA